MSRKILQLLCVPIATIVLCAGILAGCSSTGKEYIIQYTDDSGAHTIAVTGGMPYTLDVIPTKIGHDFMGLYDAEVGGKQYVLANGSSLVPFANKKNIVLFPQYKAKDYTVILDYQGAVVTGSRQLSVTYGMSFPELPNDLTAEHKEFAGWYTAAECGGTQIADRYGLIPLVSVLDEKYFDLSGTSVTLYAGFEMEKHTVTFCFEEGTPNEEMQVAYGTPISQVVAKTRVDGEAVLTWSKTRGGEVWNGKITDDMTLYAVEYAPVIEFDTNGGSEVTPVVARAGDTVALPVPTKNLAKFSHWEDMSGDRYESTTMPNTSISLKAVWQAKLVFDSNGGSDVNDMSYSAGTLITLPTPEKEGFIFAGWYTAEKDRYNPTTMPSVGVQLKAGWYKEQTEKIVVKTSEERTFNPKSICKGQSSGPTANWRSEVDLSKYVETSGASIKLSFNAKMKFDDDAVGRGGFYFYDDVLVSESNFLNKYIDSVAGTSYKSYKFEINFTTRSNTLYICYYAEVTQNISGSMWKYLMISDIWFDLYYPDTTNLYL